MAREQFERAREVLDGLVKRVKEAGQNGPPNKNGRLRPLKPCRPETPFAA